jgi:hypothetical protein
LCHKSLSSLATGPNILFQIGFHSHFSFFVIKITALSPNLIYVQSFLAISFLHLITIAFTTCHFFTFQFGVALFIATTTLSHTVAVLAVDPFRILIILAFLAHVLSATLTTDSTFNILMVYYTIKFLIDLLFNDFY